MGRCRPGQLFEHRREILRAIRRAKSDPNTNSDTDTHGYSDCHSDVYAYSYGNGNLNAVADDNTKAEPDPKAPSHSTAAANAVAVKESVDHAATGRQLEGLDVYVRLPKWLLRLE